MLDDLVFVSGSFGNEVLVSLRTILYVFNSRVHLLVIAVVLESNLAKCKDT